MSLVAGIFNRQGRPVSRSACEALRSLLSRNSDDSISEFQDHRSYFAKIDIKAFHEPGLYRDGDGNLTFLTGEALLTSPGATWRKRDEDLATIHDQALLGDWQILRRAEGTFCIVHYQPKSGALCLVTDKVGVRPMYYWWSDDTIVFASALRVLEGLDEIPKILDVRAVTEIIGLGVPLDDRTPYLDISLLRGGEILEARESEIAHRFYWQWDQIEASTESEEHRLGVVYQAFQSAIAKRSRSDQATTSYLSGGLDSRCVVAALADRGMRVHTFNFARPQTQDQRFGDDFARIVGTIHQSLPKAAGDRVPDYSELMARAWLASTHRQDAPPERPGIIWSGEGGSVLLGLVHMNETIIEQMRADRIDAAIEYYRESEHAFLPSKLFKAEVLGAVTEIIHQGIREELEKYRCPDAGRSFYLFLMHNDQRRKLAAHFENIDLHRLEFQLPFFDGELLASIVATPVDMLLRHRFYTRWLGLFPAVVTQVPWQSYPGHEPCPLKPPGDLAYQWDHKNYAREQAAQKRIQLRRAFAVLSASDFPGRLLNKTNLRLATLLHATGWRDYEYIIEAAHTVHTYWQKCSGKYNLPEMATPMTESSRASA